MPIVAELGSSEHVVVSVGDVYTPTRGLFHDPRQVDLEGRRGRCDLGSDVGPQHGTIRNPKGFKHPSKFPRCRLGRARFTVPVTSDISPMHSHEEVVVSAWIWIPPPNVIDRLK